MIDPLDVRMCNCARCERDLLGLSMRGLALPWTCDGMQFLAGRINQRPYCPVCLSIMREDRAPRCAAVNRYVASPRWRKRVEEDDPWEQLAVRCLEDCNGEE